MRRLRNVTTVSSHPVTIRRFEAADAPRVCEIYYRSVHEVASAKYDQAQVDAWAPSVPDAAKWLPILRAYYTFVAIEGDDEAIAWIAMTDAGYVDMLFCLPEATGRGIAGQLYDAVERVAIEHLCLDRMTAHASLLAQPFFAKRGWHVVEHERHQRDGVEIPRAAMAKLLRATDS